MDGQHRDARAPPRPPPAGPRHRRRPRLGRRDLAVHRAPRRPRPRPRRDRRPRDPHGPRARGRPRQPGPGRLGDIVADPHVESRRGAHDLGNGRHRVRRGRRTHRGRRRACVHRIAHAGQRMVRVDLGHRHRHEHRDRPHRRVGSAARLGTPGGDHDLGARPHRRRSLRRRPVQRGDRPRRQRRAELPGRCRGRLRAPRHRALHSGVTGSRVGAGSWWSGPGVSAGFRSSARRRRRSRGASGCPPWPCRALPWWRRSARSSCGSGPRRGLRRRGA